jgi:hypothetical protein
MSIHSTIASLAINYPINSLAESYGIKIMNVAWEDCARTKGSAFGPNISDMTLNVAGTNMPIIRKPNFADVTSDQDINKFNIVVGNETNDIKTLIPLKEYLENISKYTGNSKLGNMFLPRDEKILTSGQACILPLTDGEVEFNVKLYNYQSSNEPTVLILVCSSEGTSCQIVKGRDCTLFFNKGGLNANYIAERLTDDRKRRGVPVEGPMTNEEKQRNALLIFQIPLIKQELSVRAYGSACGDELVFDDVVYKSLYQPSSDLYDDEILLTKSHYLGASVSRSASVSRGFENAVIKTSDGFGKFIGTEDRCLVRDDKYPIRCTIQYYKVTDTIEITEPMIKEIAEQINKQYESVSEDNRGSLVFGQSDRITESVSVSVSDLATEKNTSVPYAFCGFESMMATL